MQRLCVRAQAALQPGFCRLPPPRGSALSLLVSRSQACGSVGPAAGAEGARLYTTPSRGRGPAWPPTPSRSLRAVGTCDCLSGCPASARASFCLASAFHAPSPARPAPPLLVGLSLRALRWRRTRPAGSAPAADRPQASGQRLVL